MGDLDVLQLLIPYTRYWFLNSNIKHIEKCQCRKTKGHIIYYLIYWDPGARERRWCACTGRAGSCRKSAGRSCRPCCQCGCPRSSPGWSGRAAARTGSPPRPPPGRGSKIISIRRVYCAWAKFWVGGGQEITFCKIS